MSAPKIRADHDALQGVAQKFAQQAEATRNMLQRTKADKQTLEGKDWVGKGATAFYKEMNDQVLPTLERLVRALESASTVTKQISGIMKQVEEEASGLLDGSKETGGGGGAGAGDGAGAPGMGIPGGEMGGGGSLGGTPGGGGGGAGGAEGGEGEAGIGDFMQDQIDGGGAGGLGGDGEAGIGDFMQDQIDGGGGGGLGSSFGDDYTGGANSPIGQAVNSLDGASGNQLLDQFEQAGRDLLDSVKNGQGDPNALGSGAGGGGGGGGGAGEALAALGAEDPSAFDLPLEQSFSGGGGGGGGGARGGGSSGGGGSGGGAEGGQFVPRQLGNSNLSGNQKLLALAIEILKKDPNAFNGELKKFVDAALANGEIGPAAAALRGSLRTLQGAVATAGGNVSDDVMAQVNRLEQQFSTILPSDRGGAVAGAPAGQPAAAAAGSAAPTPAPVASAPPPSNDAIMGLVQQFTRTVDNIVPSMKGL